MCLKEYSSRWFFIKRQQSQRKTTSSTLIIPYLIRRPSAVDRICSLKLMLELQIGWITPLKAILVIETLNFCRQKLGKKVINSNRVRQSKIVVSCTCKAKKNLLKQTVPLFNCWGSSFTESHLIHPKIISRSSPVYSAPVAMKEERLRIRNRSVSERLFGEGHQGDFLRRKLSYTAIWRGDHLKYHYNTISQKIRKWLQSQDSLSISKRPQ